MRAQFFSCALLWFACVILSLLPGRSAVAGEPVCYRVVNVDLWDVLYIRSARDHRSRAVGAVAPDHEAVILATGPCLPAGASTRKQWCPVEYSPLPDVRKAGFVKAYFVAKARCP